MAAETRVVLAGTVGNIIEWYDFGLYGLLAPVLASQFFPSHDQIASLLGVFGGFAVGFAMRPIGAIVLGGVGDRQGRRFVLILSVVLMGVATTAIGMLPSYNRIGVFAPILLIGIRLFQGFSVGGEFVGSVTYLVEAAPEKRRGRAGSLANMGATVGMLLAAGVAALASAHEEMTSKLWRVPFLFGGVLALAGYLLRRHLPPDETEVEPMVAPATLPINAGRAKCDSETDVAGAQAPEDTSGRWPAFQAIREAPGTMLVATLFTCGYGISNYLTMIFLPTFGHEFANVSEGAALRINTAGQALALVLVPVAGWISDRWLQRRTMLAAAFLLQAVIAWKLFGIVVQAGVMGFWATQLLLAGLLAIVMGTAPAMLAEQFPHRYRVSGHALVLNVGIGIAGGSAPMIAVALIRATASRMAPAVFLIVACLASGAAAMFLQDRSRTALDESTSS